ncbi:MAG: hypothetical protein LBT27_04010 [Prevotellaceae bacterium]|jgi:hypothetical protein|nr:hypothetical protein [Prevotellaceae bacterium]
MYRKIFIPSEQNNSIPVTIPREWYGQAVEIIIFPVSVSNNLQHETSDDDFYKLCGAWESNQSAEEEKVESF